MKKKLLNSMILGGDRSGTTWINDLCSQHPDIFVCPVSRREFLSKAEVLKRRFFSKLKFNCPLDNYNDEKIILGMRNIQLYHTPKVAEMYYNYNKNIKFLFSLRNPIDRTFSAFKMNKYIKILAGMREVNFDINNEITKEQPYVKKGNIYSMLKFYLNLFPKTNFFVFPIEKVNHDPKEWINRIFSFLDIQKIEKLNFEKAIHNKMKFQKNIQFADMNEETKKK